MTRPILILSSAAILSFSFFSMSLAEQGEGSEDKVSSNEIVWPTPPSKARYRFVRTISGESDIIKNEKGFWSSVASILFGTTEKSSQMIRPYDVAVTRSGTMVITDPGLPGIHFINEKNNSYQFVKEFDSLPMHSPISVTVSKDDHVYISDSQKKQIYIYSEHGDEVGQFDLRGSQRPTGIALHPVDQRLFVLDTPAHKILIYDVKGKKIAELGQRGNQPGEFNFPTHLGFDKSGKLYVTDSLNFRVQVFDTNLKPLRQFGRLGDRVGELSKPKGVAVDDHGNVYVLDAYFDHLLIYDHEGRFLLPIGGTGQKPGWFNLPTGIAIQAGTIYIADSFNQRIQILQRLPVK